MKLPLSLPLLARGLFTIFEPKTVIECHAYEIRRSGIIYGILSPEYHDGSQFLDLISFYPDAKVATIYTAKNDDEPNHDNKLTVTQIFNSLAEEAALYTPVDTRWLIFDVIEDSKTDEVLAGLRESSSLYSVDDINIAPGDQGWDAILSTEYYKKALQVIDKPVQGVLIRKQDRHESWKRFKMIDRIHFFFPPSKDKEPATPTAAEGLATQVELPLDYEEQKAILNGLIIYEDQEITSLSEIMTELVDLTQNTEKSHDILETWF
ncbi:hypothetical protein HOO65_090187 [Ceratocystis lukuohia]|uniref:Uncharacterized protein n=1 Tax=Ceratocystis lukuohia TaxID=2019550 RepID=A0ABR4M9E9_9PEZI